MESSLTQGYPLHKGKESYSLGLSRLSTIAFMESVQFSVFLLV